MAKASDNQTQLVVRLVDYHRNRARFGPLDFHLDEQGTDAASALTCPNGQTSTKVYRSNGRCVRQRRRLDLPLYGRPM